MILYLSYGLISFKICVLMDCLLEPSLAEAKSGDSFQFMRLGYFCVDSKSDGLVLTVLSP